MARHAEALQVLRCERREVVARWRRSCRTELERPEEAKAGSIRVDVFGHLRVRACRCCAG